MSVERGSSKEKPLAEMVGLNGRTGAQGIWQWKLQSCRFSRNLIAKSSLGVFFA
jgi:hypothetical protein